VSDNAEIHFVPSTDFCGLCGATGASAVAIMTACGKNRERLFSDHRAWCSTCFEMMSMVYEALQALDNIRKADQAHDHAVLKEIGGR
jgi:hypothetical protein